MLYWVEPWCGFSDFLPHLYPLMASDKASIELCEFLCFYENLQSIKTKKKRNFLLQTIKSGAGVENINWKWKLNDTFRLKDIWGLRVKLGRNKNWSTTQTVAEWEPAFQKNSISLIFVMWSQHYFKRTILCHVVCCKLNISESNCCSWRN